MSGIKKFKEDLREAGRGIQWVKKVHRKATLKILDGFDVADFLELDVSLS